MRTSVPGISERRPSGFTLVEMLVVLLVIGLFVGLVSAIVRPDTRALLRLEADRLAQLLDLAATEARFGGRRIAWTADASGYRFWRAGEASAWLEIRDGELRPRTLPQGFALAAFQVENLESQGAMRLEFAPEGSTLAYRVVLAAGAERYAVEGSPVGEVRVVPVTGNTGDAALAR